MGLAVCLLRREHTHTQTRTRPARLPSHTHTHTHTHTRTRARAHTHTLLVGLIVSFWCFEPSQPPRIISGLKETFIKRYIVERTNEAEIGKKRVRKQRIVRRVYGLLTKIFMKRYIVERTNKAQIRWEEESEKTENCREGLWNEIQSKGP